MPELKSSSKSKARIWSKIGERVRRDFLFQVAAGAMPGVSVHRVHGIEPSVPSVPAPVWPGAGQYPYVDAARTIQIFSDSIADNYGGAGAWLVRLVGLDQNYEIQMEDVSLRGTTVVKAIGNYTHLYHATVIKAGTRAGTIGLITLRCATDLSDLGYITFPDNQMNNGVFTVPAHTNAYVMSYHFNTVDSNQAINIGIRHTTPVVENEVWIEVFDDIVTADGHVEEHLIIPYLLPPRTDFELIAFKSGGVASEVQANALLLLIDTTFEWDDIYYQDETYTISRPNENE